MPSAQRQSVSNSEQRPARNKMISAIHVKWKKVRADLITLEELRDERLAFITTALNLRKPLRSMRDLSDRQLYRVLEALDFEKAQPRLPGSQVRPEPQPAPGGGAEIIHLASPEQIFTINKLLGYLGWTIEFQKKFMSERYKRENPVHLRPQQAQSLIRILLNIVCSRDLKDSGFKKVTRALINTQIPVLKKRLGIDRK